MALHVATWQLHYQTPRRAGGRRVCCNAPSMHAWMPQGAFVLQDDHAKVMAFRLRVPGFMRSFEGFWRMEPYPGQPQVCGRECSHAYRNEFGGHSGWVRMSHSLHPPGQVLPASSCGSAACTHQHGGCVCRQRWRCFTRMCCRASRRLA